MAKILVVDDLEDFRKLAMEILGQKHEVYVAASWDQINKYVFHENLDLVLVDVNMPILKGSEITEMLKKTAKGQAMKIVLFSSMDESELRREAKKVGADGYIPKTFDGNLLLASIERYLRGK